MKWRNHLSLDPAPFFPVYFLTETTRQGWAYTVLLFTYDVCMIMDNYSLIDICLSIQHCFQAVYDIRFPAHKTNSSSRQKGWKKPFWSEVHYETYTALHTLTWTYQGEIKCENKSFSEKQGETELQLRQPKVAKTENGDRQQHLHERKTVIAHARIGIVVVTLLLKIAH